MYQKQMPPWQTWRWTIMMVLIAVFFTLLTAFVAGNFITVEVQLVFFHWQTRLAWSLLVAAALGFFIGLFSARLRR